KQDPTSIYTAERLVKGGGRSTTRTAFFAYEAPLHRASARSPWERSHPRLGNARDPTRCAAYPDAARATRRRVRRAVHPGKVVAAQARSSTRSLPATLAGALAIRRFAP